MPGPKELSIPPTDREPVWPNKWPGPTKLPNPSEVVKNLRNKTIIMTPDKWSPIKGKKPAAA